MISDLAFVSLMVERKRTGIFNSCFSSWKLENIVICVIEDNSNTDSHRSVDMITLLVPSPSFERLVCLLSSSLLYKWKKVRF